VQKSGRFIEEVASQTVPLLLQTRRRRQSKLRRRIQLQKVQAGISGFCFITLFLK
jgi:hypothetical protein